MIRYEAEFAPISTEFMSRHIKAWCIWCHDHDKPRYQIAVCNNHISAQIIAGALNHAVASNLAVEVKHG